jgi:hypothetical protein
MKTFTKSGHRSYEFNSLVLLAQQVKPLTDLDSTEVNNLAYIANISKRTAGTMARGLLESTYGYNFCNCLNVSDTSTYKSSSSFSYETFNKTNESTIEAKPNPASDWVAFIYILPNDDSKGIIKISDVNGKVIKTFTLSGLEGQKVWDTRKTDAGIYFYTFTANGISKSGKIVINKQ